jgi:hypothetical protein
MSSGYWWYLAALVALAAILNWPRGERVGALRVRRYFVVTRDAPWWAWRVGGTASVVVRRVAADPSAPTVHLYSRAAGANSFEPLNSSESVRIADLLDEAAATVRHA